MESDKHSFIYQVLVQVWKYNILIIGITDGFLLPSFASLKS